jgi:hypothetical protein
MILNLHGNHTISTNHHGNNVFSPQEGDAGTSPELMQMYFPLKKFNDKAMSLVSMETAEDERKWPLISPPPPPLFFV